MRAPNTISAEPAEGERPLARPSRGYRRLCALLGVSLFGALTVLSALTLRTLELDPDPTSLACAALLVPLSMLLAILRFTALAKSIGVSTDFRVATGVVVWGGLANILPVPGALMVRLGFLGARVGLRRSAAANVMSVAVWITTTAAVALVLSQGIAEPPLACALLTTALIGSAVVWVTAERSAADPRQVAVLLALQSVQTALNIARSVLIATAIGLHLPISVAALMSVAGAVSASTGVLPAGLGLSELLAGGVMTYMGLSGAAGIAIAAVNRLLDWAGLLLFLPTAENPARESGRERR